MYLPQYHPVKENEDWYGKGYTEWTSVVKAKPLFKGHVQPKIPADLGFYDLRYPEIKEQQAKLAKESGVTAFCYYHYWFGGGKVMLGNPLQDIIKSGSPDFPFCVCWANHSWQKKHWNAASLKLEQDLILEQTYPGKDDIVNHFNYLLSAFKDKRYLRVDNRLLFGIYLIDRIPNFDEFKKIWNELAKENGLPGFYFISFANGVEEYEKYKKYKTDGVVLSLLHDIEPHPHNKFQAAKNLLSMYWHSMTNQPHLKYTYKEAAENFVKPICSQEDVIPVIIPNWDTTPRREKGALILTDSDPEYFKEVVKKALKCIKNKPAEKQLIVLKSWNEWGEGNYMEPDVQYGHGYLDALKSALDEINI